jgi:hypothetical protein
VTSGRLVLTAVDAIATVVWYSMLQVLPVEGGAEGRCGRSVGAAGEIATSGGSGVGGWRQGCDGHELSSPIDGIGHSRGWQPGAKISMMIMRPLLSVRPGALTPLPAPVSAKADLVESAVPLTVAHLTHHDMRPTSRRPPQGVSLRRAVRHSRGAVRRSRWAVVGRMGEGRWRWA